MRKIIEGFLFLFIPLLTIPALLFDFFLMGPAFFFYLFPISHSGKPPLESVIPSTIQVIVLVLVLIFMLFTLARNFRKVLRGKNIVNFQKPFPTIFPIFSFLTAVAIIVISFLIFRSLFNDASPQFFPLDNSQGEYKITRACPGGQGNMVDLMKDRYPSDNYNEFCVEYTGKDVFMENPNQINFFRVTVGESKVNLEPFLDKKVKNVKGFWGTAGNMAGLNIDSLELVQ
ncbi:MAG: hypothetical protein ABH816_00885 [Candidatus Levyibacteriota bacterium]